MILLNLGVNWYLYRHPKLGRRIEGEPTVLVKDGRLLRRNLKRELITEEELLATVHRQGVDSFAECAEVILETSGVITVIARQADTPVPTAKEIVARLERIERLLTALTPQPPPLRGANIGSADVTAAGGGESGSGASGPARR